ncbi:MAG: type II secretion system protein GspG [Verrucomicrobiota bacterium]|nr:type II secretion system protein GspG [Verrucomicrobiota bacterium]
MRTREQSMDKRRQEQERRARGRAGFTLIEIMLVVIILGILAAVVVVNFRGQGTTARINATRTSIQNICTAINLYETETGKLPASLRELTAATQHRPGLLRDDNLRDSWGVEFHYKLKGEFDFEVRSAGPDGQMSNEDDLTN